MILIPYFLSDSFDKCEFFFVAFFVIYELLNIDLAYSFQNAHGKCILRIEIRMASPLRSSFDHFVELRLGNSAFMRFDIWLRRNLRFDEIRCVLLGANTGANGPSPHSSFGGRGQFQSN